MKITIIYDNEAYQKNLTADWGFSCLVEVDGRKILFDTGAKGDILLANMEKLSIDPLAIDTIFISHSHWDHTGGLATLLDLNPVRVFIPQSCPPPEGAAEVIRVRKPGRLDDDNNIFSSGELDSIEQALAVETAQGLVVIVGCSHPGVRNILHSLAPFGKPFALIGGLHGFSDYQAISNLAVICPAHCTKHASKIQSLYPEKYIPGGAGKVITF